jgi:hypothetical protein
MASRLTGMARDEADPCSFIARFQGEEILREIHQVGATGQQVAGEKRGHGTSVLVGISSACPGS